MERYELVNEKGENTGKILTDVEIYNFDNIPEGHYMPVVGAIIINNKNEILLQKRSEFKRINPGKWGICGGKIDYGETPIEACIRETKEEIGVYLQKEDVKLLSQKAGNKAYYTVYYIEKDIDINELKIQKEELEKVQFFKIEELENLDNEGFEWLEDLKPLIKY